MVTEIPVFLNLTREISLSDFVNKLQTCGLGEITPYEAVYLDKDHYKNCFAFNVEGANQDDILRKLQQILSFGIGHIDFASIKFCGKGAHCCFSVVEMPFRDLSALLMGYINDTDFSTYIMKRKESICYVISILSPNFLNSLDYPEQFKEINAWKDEAKYILDYLNAGSIDFLQVGYHSIS